MISILVILDIILVSYTYLFNYLSVKMWLKFVTLFTNADFVRRTLNLQVQTQNLRNMNLYNNVTNFKT